MFSGIVEDVGRVDSIVGMDSGVGLCIASDVVLGDLNIGESIAVNGVCLTVTRFNSKFFCVDVSFETLKRTNLGLLSAGDPVNLERAIRIGDRLGGHFVLGHIDGTFRLLSVVRKGDFFVARIEVGTEWKKYCIEKGSVAVDGISLTVSSVSHSWFECVIIPHTFESTNMRFRRNGEYLNVEFDIIGKYVESFVRGGNDDMQELLRRGGFLGE